jgi:hypothetical protein
MTKQEKFDRMQAALKNILDISLDPFSLSMARHGLNWEENEGKEIHHEPLTIHSQDN